MEITEREFGVDHVATATLYHNLAGLEHARGNYELGEFYGRRGVAIREAALKSVDGSATTDRADLSLAADLANLAGILDGKGEYDEAEQIYRRVLTLFAEKLGPESYETAVNLKNLAANLYARGRLDEAEPLYRQSLAIK